MNEEELIAASRDAVAKVKALLANLDDYAAQLATINHKDGRYLQSTQAMNWQAAIKRINADLLDAHAAASIALIQGYGAEVMTRGPGR